MARYFHVSSARNRESIRAYGLDWTRMGDAPGIAGSRTPEQDGVFLCASRSEAGFFVGFTDTDRPVDVWAADGIDAADLISTDSGYDYLPARIPPNRVVLLEQDLVPPEQPAGSTTSGAYRSSLTITLDDGTMLTGDDAHAYLARRRGAAPT